MEPSPSRTLAALALGVAFDLTTDQPAPGASIPLLVLLSAVLVRATSPRSRERDLLLTLAVLVSAVAVIRAEAAVVTPAMLAVAGLFVVAATGPGADRITIRSALGRSLGMARALFRSPGFVAAPASRLLRDAAAERMRAVLRITAIAAPVIVVFAVLFASADRVFADALMPDVSLRFGSVFGHGTMMLVGTWIAGAWWPSESLAIEATPPQPAAREPRLAPAEWTVALGGLALLFTVFVIVQFAFLFGGRGRVEVTPGLTYAEYARSGFFQLLAAGGLTAGVILAAWDLGRRDTDRDRRRFLWLCASLTGLCLVVLASAATRLALYQASFGFTTTRLAAWFAIGATGAALCGLVVAIAARQRRRILAGGIGIGLAAVLAAALLSPSAFVARRNIERFEGTGKIDVAYLTTLGPEAAPALTALVPGLRDEDRTLLRASLCSQWSAPPRGRRWTNLARLRARDAVATLDCDGPRASGSP
ncbi:MAG TPA: DUF4173 domain-containing protein [Actinomycetota bacterium]